MYELIFILSALNEKPDAAVIAKIRDFINGSGGLIKKEDVWEKRKFAYQIEKQQFGHYIIFEFELSREKVVELQNLLKSNEDILRFLVLNKEGIKEPPKRIRPIKPKAFGATPALRTEEKGERVKIEELDKKLEEILKE
jgi:small subunit ribosomal protein S6